MKWLLVSSFLAFAAIAGAPLATRTLCPACVDHNRDNARCEWTGDAAFVIDPSKAAERRHLVQDAQLAEGLATRFADAEYGRLYGVDHHGGLIDSGRIVRECAARMFSMIAHTHHVTDDQIQSARAERNWLFDAVVRALFLPLYVLAAIVVSRVLARRFSTDGSRVMFVATCLASVAVALLGSYLLVLWSMPWEAIRVGNGHIGGYRAATLNRHGVGVVFAVAMFVFWTTVQLRDRILIGAAVGASALACALLAAMFVRTFATGASGWIAVSAALVAVVVGVHQAGRFAIAEEATTGWLVPTRGRVQ